MHTYIILYMNLLLYPAELLHLSEGQQDTTAITQTLPVSCIPQPLFQLCLWQKQCLNFFDSCNARSIYNVEQKIFS